MWKDKNGAPIEVGDRVGVYFDFGSEAYGYICEIIKVHTSQLMTSAPWVKVLGLGPSPGGFSTEGWTDPLHTVKIPDTLTDLESIRLHLMLNGMHLGTKEQREEY